MKPNLRLKRLLAGRIFCHPSSYRRMAIGSVLLVALLAVKVSCADNAPSLSADLEGPSSLSIAGQFLLVANSSQDELQVLDTAQGPPRFVRAPNPLFPLSIPTAPAPVAVASYTSTEGVTAPLAFALSVVNSQVTALSTKRLVTLGSFPVPTSAVSIAMLPYTEGSDVQLVLGVVEEESGNGAIYLASFAQSLAQSQSARTELLQTSLDSKYQAPFFQPQAMAISPRFPQRLAIANRLGGEKGTQGLLMCDLAPSPAVCEAVDVGGPLKSLAFNSAGTRLFGLLEPDTCTAEASCNGIVAVDIQDGVYTKVDKELKVPGVPRGIAVAAGEAQITLPDGQVITVVDPALVSSSDGHLYPLDGANFQLLNGVDQGKVVIRRPDGSSSSAASSDFFNLSIGDIQGSQEKITVTWEGVLGSWTQGAIESGKIVENGANFDQKGIEQGDLVVFESYEGCPSVEANIEAVSANELVLSHFESECLPPVFSYAVRVADKYLVQSNVRQNLGRVSRGETFDAEDLSFRIGNRVLERDWAYELEIMPFSIDVGATLSMPSAVVSHPTSGRFYAIYLGGHALVMVDLAGARNGTARGVTVFD